MEGSWLVLPFFDTSGFNKVISEFRKYTSLPADIAPRISWSLGVKKLSQKLQRILSPEMPAPMYKFEKIENKSGDFTKILYKVAKRL